MFAPMRAFPRSPSVGFTLGLIFSLRKLFQKFRDTIRNRLRKIIIRTQVLSDHPLSLTNGRSFFGLGNTRSWRTFSWHGSHSTAFSSQWYSGKTSPPLPQFQEFQTKSADGTTNGTK